MSSRGRSLRFGVLAVATCGVLMGAALVVRAEIGPGQPLENVARKVTSQPTRTPVSAKPSAAASPSGGAPLSQQVAARAAELRRLAEKAAALTRNRKRERERPVSTFTFSTFNVQGAVHRGNIGLRTALARDLLNRYRVDVVALQEFERPQRAIFDRIAGSTYQVYPGNLGRSIDGENSVAWRRDRFDLVSGETRPYPYFGGAIRNMPRVLLRDKKTGAQFYVTSYHNPASCCHFGNQTRFRSIAVSRQIADANAVVAAAKQPLIVAGDMNDRAAYFCKMAGGTGMHSADGSSYQVGCRVAPRPWIDWVVGTPDVTFSGYLRVRDGTVRRATDHAVVFTQVRVNGKAGDALRPQ